jgi:serine/threonine-protein kinase
MPQHFVCLRGHQFQLATGETPDPGAGHWRCPECGERAEPVTLPAGEAPTASLPPAGHATVSDAKAVEGPTADRPWPTLPGYELLNVAGRGGMGVVYRARQTGLNRIVAVKVLLAGAHAGPRELARFRAEAEAVGKLRHPNIVAVHDAGTADGLPYLTLEYVEGGNLARKAAGRPLPLAEAARLVETLARAIQTAHDNGILHRDLKPANVLLTADGTPKITDFGLSKRLDGDERHTASGAILGTASYMAPEQAGGKRKNLGPATDVYALGAILYELLTGRPPFRAETDLDTILAIHSAPPVPPRKLAPGVPRDLEAICLRCLEKEPARRYASAAALAEDLRRWTAGMKPRPPRSGRRRLVLAALALLAVTLAVVAFLRRADTDRARNVPPGDALPADLALVPRDAFAFVSVRVSELLAKDGSRRVEQALLQDWPGIPGHELEATLRVALGVGPRKVTRATLVTLEPVSAARSTCVILAMEEPYDPAKVRELLKLAAGGPAQPGKGPVARAGAEIRETVVRGMTWLENPNRLGLSFLLVNDRVLAITFNRMDERWLAEAQAGVFPEPPMARFLERFGTPDDRGPLSEMLTLAARGDYLAVAACHPTAGRLGAWAPVVRDLLPVGPEDLEMVTLTAGPSARADTLCTAAFRFREGTSLEGWKATALPVATTAVRSLAAWLKTRWDDDADWLSRYPMRHAAEFVERALAGATVEDAGNELRVHLPAVAGLDAELVHDVGAIREHSYRAADANNLRLIALALHNYHNTYGHLPPAAVVGRDGTPLLSWRVELLPFLEYGTLYGQFRRDEPWDGPHNAPLLDRMPRCYASPKKSATRSPHDTYYQVFTGEPAEAPFGGGRVPNFRDFTDGLANTFLVVEGGTAVPWTQPTDLAYSAKGPLPKLGGTLEGGFNAAFGDGRVFFIKRSRPEAELRALITPAGGEQVRPDR